MSLWETRYSARGHPYQMIRRQRMPRIPDFMQECVAYMYPDERSAAAGERIGGSALLMAHHDPEDASYHEIYVVTNSHVIDEGNFAVRLNTQAGIHDVIPTNEMDWIHHPSGDDLAICPMKIDLRFFKYVLVTPNMLATREIVEKFSIGLGDDCFILGRFVNREGKQKNWPAVRFGNIAQMPSDPIRRIRSDDTLIDQDSYLVEAHSISGYSGAPVFVHFPAGVGRYNPKPPPLPLPGEWRGPWVLGINWCYLKGPPAPVHRIEPNGALVETNFKAQTNSGMMGVVPAWKLDELINHPPLVRLREARYAAEKHEREQNPAPSQTTSVPASGENPSHKEDFTRLLNAAVKSPQSDGQT